MNKRIISFMMVLVILTLVFPLDVQANSSYAHSLDWEESGFNKTFTFNYEFDEVKKEEKIEIQLPFAVNNFNGGDVFDVDDANAPIYILTAKEDKQNVKGYVKATKEIVRSDDWVDFKINGEVVQKTDNYPAIGESTNAPNTHDNYKAGRKSDKNESGDLYWEVNVGALRNGTNKDIIVVDELGEGHELLENTLQIEELYNEGNDRKEADYEIIHLNSEGYAIKLHKIPFGSQVLITYNTSITNHSLASYSNQVQIGNDKKQSASVIIKDDSGVEGENPSIEEKKELKVIKEWVFKSKSLKTPVEIVLLENGKKTTQKIILSEENNWSHIFEHLSLDKEYTVAEVDVPEGFYVEYDYSNDGVVKIINTELDPALPQVGEFFLRWEYFLALVLLSILAYTNRKKV